MKKVFLILSSFLFLNLHASDGFDPRLEIGVVGGRFIGEHESYAELGLFAPIRCGCSITPFIDFKEYFLFDSGHHGSSLGIGNRWYTFNYENFIGANLYYDYIEGSCKGFQRLGLGLEYVTPCYEIYLNTYIPLNRKHEVCNLDFIYPSGAYIGSFTKYETIPTGFDLEIGLPWELLGISFYSGLGMYGFTHHDDHKLYFGGFLSYEASWKDLLRAEIKVSGDKYHHIGVQGKIFLEISLDHFCHLDRLFSLDSCDEECYFHIPSVKRDGLIFKEKHCCWSY